MAARTGFGPLVTAVGPVGVRAPVEAGEHQLGAPEALGVARVEGEVGVDAHEQAQVPGGGDEVREVGPEQGLAADQPQAPHPQPGEAAEDGGEVGGVELSPVEAGRSRSSGSGGCSGW